MITLHDTVINEIEGSQLSEQRTWIVLVVIVVLCALRLIVGTSAAGPAGSPRRR